MPEENRDSDTGRYTDKFAPDEFTDAIRECGGAVGTQEVADSVGAKYDTAYSKLRQLEEEGVVKSRKVANARLWSVADE